MKKIRSLVLFSLILSFANIAIAEDAPVAILAIDRDLFEADYSAFLKDFSFAHPDLKLSPQTPTAFFKPNLKRNEELDYFISWTAEKNKVLPQNLAKFETAAIEEFTSYSRNVGYARLAYLEALDEHFGSAQAEIKSDEKIKLPDSFPPNHTLDLKIYTDERFPKTFQKFVLEQRAELYLHDSNCEDAVAYQKSQGFNKVYRFMGARDAFDSQFLFVYEPVSAKYRYVVCELHGQDDMTRIISIPRAELSRCRSARNSPRSKNFCHRIESLRARHQARTE